MHPPKRSLAPYLVRLSTGLGHHLGRSAHMKMWRDMSQSGNTSSSLDEKDWTLPIVDRHHSFTGIGFEFITSIALQPSLLPATFALDRHLAVKGSSRSYSLSNEIRFHIRGQRNSLLHGSSLALVGHIIMIHDALRMAASQAFLAVLLSQ
ncbi:hypothetical protein CLAIMM_09378 [Cladophialophora immunda]|nr:hypothetical protein CLAIMM_09378 [Cladophialophora immunda]